LHFAFFTIHALFLSDPVTSFFQELLEVVPPPKVEDEDDDEVKAIESASEDSMQKAESIQF